MTKLYDYLAHINAVGNDIRDNSCSLRPTVRPHRRQEIHDVLREVPPLQHRHLSPTSTHQIFVPSVRQIHYFQFWVAFSFFVFVSSVKLLDNVRHLLSIFFHLSPLNDFPSCYQ